MRAWSWCGLLWVIWACDSSQEMPAHPLASRVLHALRSERPYRVRLSTRAAYVPCATRDSAQVIPDASCLPTGPRALASLTDAAALVVAQLRDSTTTDALWASALVELGTGAPDPRQVERAIARLREVVARDSSLGLAWSHLSTAHIIRARLREDPRDLFAALDFAERAWEVDSTSPALAFNRAWVQSLIGVRRSATLAWEAALALRDDSGWRDEAEIARGDIAVVPRGPLTLTTEAIRSDPQAARNFVFDSLVPRWVEALDAADTSDAAFIQGQVLLIAESLQSSRGDSSIHHLAAELASGGATRAHAVKAYLAGVGSYRRQSYAEALPVLAEAREHLQASNAPALADWSAVMLGATRMAGREHDAASRLLDHVQFTANARGDRALAAMAAWAGAIAHTRAGRHDVGESMLERAAQDFAASGEAANAATMATMLSDVQYQVGRARDAAISAFRGFRASVRSGGSPRYEDLLGMAGQLTDVGQHHAASLLLQEALLVARALGRPKDAPETLARHAIVQLTMGRRDAAGRSLREARHLAVNVRDQAMRARLDAELDRAEGRLAMLSDPARGLTLISKSLAYFGTNPAEAIHLHAAAAGAALAGGDTVRAEQELARSIGLARDMRPTASPAAVRQLLALVREAHRRAVAIALARGDSARAFGLAVALPSLVVGETMRRLQDAPALPVGLGELRFVVLEDEVISWARAGQRLSFARHGIGRGALANDLLRYLNVLRSGLDTLAVRAQGRAWYAALVQPHVGVLAGVRQLNVHPDGVLGDLPVVALVAADGEFVGDHVEVRTIVPSTASGSGAGKVRRGVPLLVGNPSWRRSEHPGLEPLRWADEEIRLVGEQYPEKTVLSGEAATREALLRELPRHEVMHFAGHSRVVVENPGRSHLVLAAGGTFGEGVLYADEIARLDLRSVKLVVLSSCGRTRDDVGSLGEVNALAQAFLDAGVERVIASLWEATDQPVASTSTKPGDRKRDLGIFTYSVAR